MGQIFLLLGVTLSCVVTVVTSARILGIIPSPSYSHQVVFQPLWRELSLKGHQVTVLTTDPIKDPSLKNLTEIDLHFSYDKAGEDVLRVIAANEQSVVKLIDLVFEMYRNMTDAQFSHPSVKALIDNKKEHFDLLIVEHLFPAMFVFAERFKCPIIGVTSLDSSNAVYEMIGNPAHSVLAPPVVFPFAGELTFVERLVSVFFDLFMKFTNDNTIMPYAQAVVDKHFGTDYPPLEDIVRNISMLFVNTDPIFHPIRPLVPAVIQIGAGIHLKPPKALPKDLQRQLDKATQGFIYFSLGSNVRSKDFSKEKIVTILETFAELPYLVLWKFEAEGLPITPDNVIVSKWFPQQDVLRHKNIKLFITQGGLQSIDEAIHTNGVPMLGIPFFADQHGNVKRIVHLGLGLSLANKDIEKKTFREMILELIENPKYHNRVKELGALARDQPMTGLEKAVWWTEYVLRHKGAKHLRSPTLDIPFYQYYLLDVTAFLLLVVFVVIFLMVNLVKLVFKVVKFFLSKPKPNPKPKPKVKKH